MENETEKKAKNMYVPICITQTVCVVVVLIIVLVIKLFFLDAYKEIKKWHNDNFLQETTVTAVFEEEET